jgi:hypothetical protein
LSPICKLRILARFKILMATCQIHSSGTSVCVSGSSLRLAFKHKGMRS